MSYRAFSKTYNFVSVNAVGTDNLPALWVALPSFPRQLKITRVNLVFLTGGTPPAFKLYTRNPASAAYAVREYGDYTTGLLTQRSASGMTRFSVQAGLPVREGDLVTLSGITSVTSNYYNTTLRVALVGSPTSGRNDVNESKDIYVRKTFEAGSTFSTSSLIQLANNADTREAYSVSARYAAASGNVLSVDLEDEYLNEFGSVSNELFVATETVGEYLLTIRGLQYV